MEVSIVCRPFLFRLDRLRSDCIELGHLLEEKLTERSRKERHEQNKTMTFITRQTEEPMRTAKGEKGQWHGQQKPRRTFDTEARRTLDTEARRTLDTEARRTFDTEARRTLDTEARRTFDTEARRTLDTEARRTLDTEARRTLDTEARRTLDTEARRTLDTEARRTLDTEARRTLNTEARRTLDTEARSTLDTEARRTLDTEARRTLDTEARRTLDTEARRTLNTEARRTLDTEARSTLDTEARRTLDTAMQIIAAISKSLPPTPPESARKIRHPTQSPLKGHFQVGHSTTIPKPFRLASRSPVPCRFAKRHLEAMLEERRRKEEAERRREPFRAKPVPQSTYRADSDIRIGQLKRKRTLSLPDKAKQQNVPMRGQSVPLSTYIRPNSAMEETRKLRRQRRAVEELAKAKGPRGMEEHSVRWRIRWRLRHSVRCLPPSPVPRHRSLSVPDFALLHAKFQRQLAANRQVRRTTTAQPFRLTIRRSPHNQHK